MNEVTLRSMGAAWVAMYEIARVPTLRRITRYKCIVTDERAICVGTHETRRGDTGGSRDVSGIARIFFHAPPNSRAYQSRPRRISAYANESAPRDRDINPRPRISRRSDPRGDATISQYGNGTTGHATRFRADRYANERNFR